MSAVVIRDSEFHDVEFAAGITLETLLPEDKWGAFKEFKTCELFGGYGVFQAIDQEWRHAAIKQVLRLLEDGRIAVVYGAVHLDQLRGSVYGSAIPKDICFRICASGVENYVMQNVETEPAQDMALIIMDECDPPLKRTLYETFRDMRRRVVPPDYGAGGRLYQLHDDMYFGDSRFSIGIQLADMCSYFIAKHLMGDDVSTQGFYSLIEPHIKYSEEYPKNGRAVRVRPV